MIVVIPNGRAMKDDRAVGNIFDSAKVKAFTVFEKDLLNDLIPYIQKNYSGLYGQGTPCDRGSFHGWRTVIEFRFG